METNKLHSTKAERQAHIDAWHQSGVSQQTYCKQAGVNYYTFNSWITKQKIKPTEPDKFLKVEIADAAEPVQTKTFATLIFRNGFTLQLHTEVSAQFLKQLLPCK